MSKRKKPIVMVVTTKKRFALSKRVLVAGLITLLALAAIGGAVWYALDDKGAPSGKKDTGKSPEEVQKQVDSAYARADYAQAVGALKAQDSSDPDAQLKLATAYSNNKQYAEALAIFDELSKAGKLNSTYTETAAQVAESAGDKPKAINYYRMAKQKVREEKLVTAESRAEFYDQRIKALGGQ